LNFSNFSVLVAFFQNTCDFTSDRSRNSRRIAAATRGTVWGTYGATLMRNQNPHKLISPSVMLYCVDFVQPNGFSKFWTPLKNAHGFQKLCEKIYFENQVVFANLRMRAKKAYNEKILDQKIQKNWGFHEKVYAKLKHSQNNVPERHTELCPIEVFANFRWPIRCPILYCAASVHRKLCQNFGPPLNNALGFKNYVKKRDFEN